MTHATGGLPARCSWAPLLLVFLAVVGCQLYPLGEASPFQVRSQHPAQLTVLHLDPRPAHATAPGHGSAQLLLDWSNVWVLPGDGADTIRLDGELLRSTAVVRIGIWPGVDLETQLPLQNASGGVLDSFVESWHELFGFPDNDRSAAPRDEFRMEARRVQPGGGTRTAYRLEPHGVRLGDVPIVLSWFPFPSLEEHGFGLGVRAGLELPTGDERDGLGNGGVDAGLGLLGGWQRHGLAMFSWYNHTWVAPADTADEAGLNTPDVSSAGFGGELGVLAGTSLVAQLEWSQLLLRELDQDSAGHDQTNLWFGVRTRLSRRCQLEIALGEDLAREVSPDITLHLGLRYSW